MRRDLKEQHPGFYTLARDQESKEDSQDACMFSVFRSPAVISASGYHLSGGSTIGGGRLFPREAIDTNLINLPT
jgi:hypothetical protein